MKKLLEADFFPRASGTDSPQPDSVSRSADKGKRRILIVDDDANSTHLVKILLQRSGPYSFWRKTIPPKLIKRPTVLNRT
jgi:hypothetical protein